MAASCIKWHSPLDRIMGPVTEVDLDGPTPVKVLLSNLRDQKPELKKFVRFESGDTYAWDLLVLRNSETLTLSDRVEPGDMVEVLVMMEGGSC